MERKQKNGMVVWIKEAFVSSVLKVITHATTSEQPTTRKAMVKSSSAVKTVQNTVGVEPVNTGIWKNQLGACLDFLVATRNPTFINLSEFCTLVRSAI